VEAGGREKELNLEKCWATSEIWGRIKFETIKQVEEGMRDRNEGLGKGKGGKER
jgi:hypothetical protein